MSLKLSVIASTRTRTSPGPASGASTSSSRRTSRGAPCSTARQARTGESLRRRDRARAGGSTDRARCSSTRADHRLAHLVVRVARQELLERDPRLEAGQRGPDAEVDAEPEADVTLDVTVDVEVLGIGEGPLVVVGGAGDQDHPRVGGDGDAVQGDVLLDPAALVVRRRVPAEHLLDRVRDERRVGHQLGPLVGVPVERDDAVGDQLGGGLVAGDGELEQSVRDLLVGERDLVAVVVGHGRGEQQRRDVVAEVASTSRRRSA